MSTSVTNSGTVCQSLVAKADGLFSKSTTGKKAIPNTTGSICGGSGTGRAQDQKAQLVTGDCDLSYTSEYTTHDLRHASSGKSVSDQSENKSVADLSRRNFLGAAQQRW
jgi:hypothetical protein